MVARETALHGEIWLDDFARVLSEAIITCDEGGRIAIFNEAAERITAWSSQEAVGQPLDDVLRLPDGEGRLTDCLPRGISKRLNLVDRHDKPVAVIATATAVWSSETGRDVPALVLQPLPSPDDLQHLRSGFLANVTHEFRTPLSAIKASVEYLLGEVDNLAPDELRQLLTTIHLSVTGLQTLIENLLESSNIEAGRFRVRRQPIELGEAVADAARVMQPLLDRRQQQLIVRQEPALPLALGDPVRLAQVLVNLISNASKYGPMGQTIEVRLERAGSRWLRASVADHGPGIPPAVQADLFRRFVRLGAPGGPQVGIGLGLSVVKAIVTEHGGEVGVEERPGGGAIFWFTVPVAMR